MAESKLQAKSGFYSQGANDQIQGQSPVHRPCQVPGPELTDTRGISKKPESRNSAEQGQNQKAREHQISRILGVLGLKNANSLIKTANSLIKNPQIRD